jgi:hypothetical protein
MANLIDFYDPDVFKTAGGLNIVNRATLAERFQGGLFHLVYAIVYDKETRDELRALRPPKYTEDQIRDRLTTKFLQEYGVTGVARDTLIALHLAGVRWVDAYNANKMSERDQQEAIFKQQLAAVTWLLWEDGAGPLFALPW